MGVLNLPKYNQSNNSNNSNNSSNKNNSNNNKNTKEKRKGVLDLEEYTPSKPPSSTITVSKPIETPKINLLPSIDKKALQEFVKYSNVPKVTPQNSIAKDIAEKYVSAGTGLLDSATLGLAPTLLKQTPSTSQTYELAKKVQEKQPVSSTVGKVLGYAVPGVGIAKGLKFIPGVNKILPTATDGILKTAGKTATIGALEGLPMGAVEGSFESIRENKPIFENTIKRGLEGGMYGALGGGVLGGTFKGLSKGVSSINNAINKSIDNTMDEFSSTIKPSIEGNSLNAIPKSFNTISDVTSLKPKIVNKPLSEIVKAEQNIKYNTPIFNATTPNLTPKQQSNINLLPKEINTNMGQNKANFNIANIKTLDDLPKDEEGLKTFIDESNKLINSGNYKNLKIDLQLFSKEAEKRLQNLSKVYKNTFENSDMFNKAEKDILNSSFTNDAKYNVKSEAKSIENAKNRLANDYAGEFQRLQNKEAYTGEDVDTLFGILEQEKLKARQTGDYTLVRQIAKDGVKKAGTEGGRAVQAFAKYTRTAEGKLTEAQRTIDNIEDAIKKQNPNIANKINQEEKQIKDVINNSKKQKEKTIENTVSEILNKRINIQNRKIRETNFPKMLKEKIIKGLNPKTPEDLGFIRTMIKDLFGEAKENIEFPPIPKNKPRNIKTLSDSYKYREYARSIREDAKEMLKNEFKDSPKTLELLDNYFNKNFRPPHSEGLLNKVINERLSKKNITSWVKDFYSTGRVDRENFIESIIKETGLDKDNAQSLKNLLESKLKKETKIIKDSLLEQIMKPKKESVVKSISKKLTELTNIGLLENNKFVDRINEKISPIIKQFLKEQNLTLNNIVNMSLKERKSAKAFLLRDVFKNTKVDDKEIIKLLDVINNEFNSLTTKKQQQILNNMLKERKINKKTLPEKILEKINQGVYDDEVEIALRTKIKEKYGLPDLSQSDVKFIVETMDNIKTLPENSEAYREGLAKVDKLILEKVPASLSDKIQSLAFTSMLGNFTSPAINLLGNSLIGASELAGNTLARGYDKLISKAFNTGNRTAGKINVKTLFKGALKGGRQVKRDFLGGRDIKDLNGKTIKEVIDILANPINTDITVSKVGDKFEQGKRLAFDNKFGRILENVVRTNMKWGDIPFNSAYFDDALQQLMKANKVSEPTEDMLKTAFQVSQERTFKDNNIISDSLVALKNLPKTIQNKRGFVPEAQKGFKKAVAETPQIIFNSQIPFAMTPGNLIKRGLEYSPLGFVEGVGKLLLNKKNLSMMKQREIVDRLTRGTIGSLGLGLGAYGYNKGFITNSKDDNKDVEKLKQEEGLLPDALKYGNKTIDLKKIQPASTPIIAGSRLKQGQGEGILESILSGAEGALSLYTDMPMLQGFTKLSQLFQGENGKPTDKQKILTDILMTLPQQLVPSIVKKITYSMDPFERNLDSDNKAQGSINKIVGKLPGISTLYPPKVDVYGNSKLNYDGNNSMLNTQLNPILSKNIKNNKITNEALRLNKSSIDEDMKNKVIPKEVSRDLGDVKLTIEEQNKYQKLMGDKLINKINLLLNNAQYNALNDNQKALAFSKAIDNSREEAKQEMLQFKGIKEDKFKKKEERINKEMLYKQLNLNQQKSR